MPRDMICKHRMIALRWLERSLAVIRITRLQPATRSRSCSVVDDDSNAPKSLREWGRIFVTGDHLNEAFPKCLLLCQRECRLVFDGVRNPTQEISVGHGPAQAIGQLWNGEGEGA